MAVSQKDIKLLWGRAASRCSICRARLTEDKTTANESFPLGEQAHIVADDARGPRGVSILTVEERDSYHNLILLCPTHHTVVDKDPEDFPVEKLHMLKATHELWVERSLAERQDAQSAADEQVLADIVDAAVSMCRLDEWEIWTSWALSTDPVWPGKLRQSIREFRHKVMRVVWPKRAGELRAAVIHLSVLLDVAAAEFTEISIPDHDDYVTDRYYRRAASQELYDEKHAEFTGHLSKSHSNIIEAAMAANWLAAIVRRDMNPMFLLLRGRFTVTEGPLMDPPLAFRTSIFEYTEEETAALVTKYSGDQV